MVPGGLYEREDELARVDALMTAAYAGRGGVLLIAGPAGIGKTVLLESARERASQAGMRVLAGRGGELESGFSFGVVRQLFEPLLVGASAAEREALLAGAARRALLALEDFRGQARCLRRGRTGRHRWSPVANPRGSGRGLPQLGRLRLRR